MMLHMAINNVAGEWVYHVRDILRKFLGHNFVSGLRTLKPKNLKKNNNLKKLVFFSSGRRRRAVRRRRVCECCRRKQSAPLQRRTAPHVAVRCRTTTYGSVHSVNGV